ncbi:MAG: phosphatidate cytidylyltransferase [Anaerolineaceae bacterium]
MFWTRFKSAAVFVPLFLVMAYLGGFIYDLFILVILGIGTWEYWRLLKTMGYYVSLPTMLGGVGLLLILRMTSGFAHTDIALFAILFVTMIVSLGRYEKGDTQAVLTFAMHISAILYLGWLGGYFISIRNLPNGRWWMIVTIILVWLVDLGAYIVGSWFGRHKMFPRLSPRKSWEGFLGGILFGSGFGALLSLILHPVLPELQLWEGVVLGLVIALITPFGDIFISMIKRVAGVKDSGTLIPGHGGILDRADTWIWAMMLGYYLATLFA